MKAVILAGGLGVRLRPFTQIIPKPILPIGESSVLEIQINSLIKHGATEIIIATNYKSNIVKAYLEDGKKYNIPITFSLEDKPLGTCGPISLLKEKLKDEPFILMNGDILTNADLSSIYNFSLELKSGLLVVTKKIHTPFNFGKVIKEGDYITDIKEKPDFEIEIISGIYVINPSIFKHIPEDKYFGIDDLINKLLARNEKVGRYLIKEYWLDIGSLEDYDQAQKVYEEYFSDNN